MLITLWPALIALVGVLMYALCSNGKLVEIGRILFFVGVLWLVQSMANKTIKIGHNDRVSIERTV